VEFPCARTGQVPTLDELDSFDAVICPGSRYSATDDTLVFLPSLLAVLSQISKQCRPQLLGICFGHQAVARALGGQVGKNSGGEFRFAAEQVVCSPQWSQLPYVQAGGDVRGDEGGRGGGGGAERAHCQDEVGEDLLLLTSHGDCVEALPSEATRVATSDSTENEIFVVSDHVLSFQTHPEFSNCPPPPPPSRARPPLAPPPLPPNPSQNPLLVSTSTSVYVQLSAFHVSVFVCVYI